MTAERDELVVDDEVADRAAELLRGLTPAAGDPSLN